ncbi:arsenic transporter [Deinococcus roseus]|uniref:Arsenical pump membrane protein n=1 Tax=Deinococcus roseus TaxID=392414 RepID=A0ABQ2DDL2_9DEIO|nr:arsenic transporter [Deinococcus roseus]GGJ53947.1 arsenical pump membrane protein [Deinococcus roseus]
MLLALILFLVTLVLVILQPFKLSIGWSATIGAVIALLLGLVDVQDVQTVWGLIWNATLTFIALIVISLLLDEAGFFKWTALHVSRWGGGSGKRLFVLMVVLGAAVTSVFANDGAALILTPIMLEILFALGFTGPVALAFVMAVGFIADATSLPLIISNLTNIITADYFSISFERYASVMVWVNLASLAGSLGLLYWIYHKSIPAKYDLQSLPDPQSAIRSRGVFMSGWAVLLVLLLGYFSAERLHVPVSFITVAGALWLWLVGGQSRKLSTRKVLKGAPWHIVVFSLGMYLVVYGLKNQGLTSELSRLLEQMGGNLWTGTLGAGFLVALLSSLMNNLPTVLIGALAIDGAQVSQTIKEGMIYANVVGSDLGPKITPIGSLATLLWMHVLALRGIQVTWGYYFRIGLLLTVPVLLLTLVVLVVVLKGNAG